MSQSIFITSYDPISKMMISSLLNNYPGCFCTAINPQQLLPQFIAKSIDEVIIEKSNDKALFTCDVDSFTAFHLKNKMLVENPTKLFKSVNIKVAPLLRIKFILHTWFNLGIPSEDLVSRIDQLIKSQTATRESLLNSYNTFHFLDHIINMVKQNFAALFPNETSQKIPANVILFMFALAITIAFDRIDSACAEANFDLEKLLLSEDEVNHFFKYIFNNELTTSDPYYQNILNSRKVALDILKKFNMDSWENWQVALMKFYFNEQNVHNIENSFIHSQYFSILAKLNLVDKNKFCFTNQFMYVPSFNIYYLMVPLFGLETTFKKECILDSEKIKLIKEKKARLLLDLSGEALTYDEQTRREWLSLIRILQEAEIPPERVYLLCSNYQLANYYSQWAEQLNVNYPIRTMGNNYYLFSRAHALLHDQMFQNKQQEIISLAKKNIEENTLRPYHFMCLNLKERLSRQIILLFLLDRNYLQKGIVTYFGRHSILPEQTPYDLNKNANFTADGELAQFVKKIPGEEKILLQFDKFEKMRPIVYDIPKNGTLSEQWPLAQLIPELAYHGGFKQIDTYFEIVTETYFTDEKTLYLTEKTIRPILRLQMFIIVGSPFTLRFLKSRGFQTFAPYIDESYDEISDPIERMAAIMREIDKLCSLDISELHEIYCQLWPRVLHNYELYTQKIPQVCQHEANELFELLTS